MDQSAASLQQPSILRQITSAGRSNNLGTSNIAKMPTRAAASGGGCSGGPKFEEHQVLVHHSDYETRSAQQDMFNNKQQQQAAARRSSSILSSGHTSAQGPAMPSSRPVSHPHVVSQQTAMGDNTVQLPVLPPYARNYSHPLQTQLAFNPYYPSSEPTFQTHYRHQQLNSSRSSKSATTAAILEHSSTAATSSSKQRRHSSSRARSKSAVSGDKEHNLIASITNNFMSFGAPFLFDWRLFCERGQPRYVHKHDGDGLRVDECEARFLRKIAMEEKASLNAISDDEEHSTAHRNNARKSGRAGNTAGMYHLCSNCDVTDKYFRSCQCRMPWLCAKVGIFVSKKMADTKKKFSRVGAQARLERLLGMSQGHHLALLSMQL